MKKKKKKKKKKKTYADHEAECGMSKGDKLRDEYGTWGEHPDHPVQDWAGEVDNDDTRLGYWDWVANEMDR